jgi:hypothetical protein
LAHEHICLIKLQLGWANCEVGNAYNLLDIMKYTVVHLPVLPEKSLQPIADA